MRTTKYFFVPLFLIVLLFVRCEKDSEIMDVMPYQNQTEILDYDDNNEILATSPENDLCLTSSLRNYTSINLLTVGTHDRMLFISYDDPVKDHTGSIDVEKMYLVFEPSSGDYDLIIKSTNAYPFVDRFRVNINLHNPGKPFFQDVMNDYDLLGRSTVLNLTGNNIDLMEWAENDRVAASTLAGLGNPPGSTYFRSGVVNYPFGFLSNEDAIAFGTGQGITKVKKMTDEVMCDILITETRALVNVLSKYAFTDKMNECLLGAVKFLHLGRVEIACKKFSEFEYEVEGALERGLITTEQSELLLFFSSKLNGDCSGTK